MKLAGNFLVLIFSVSSVLRSSPARLPTYCYGYHLDKYNPVLSAPTSLWVFPTDAFLSRSFFSLFPASPQPVSKTFMIALHLLLWGCSLQFPASAQKASSLLKLQWNWVFVHFPLPWLRDGACNYCQFLLQGFSAVLAAAAHTELIHNPPVPSNSSSENHPWVIFQHLAQLSCLTGNAHPEIQIKLLFPSLTAVLWRAPVLQRAGVQHSLSCQGHSEPRVQLQSQAVAAVFDTQLRILLQGNSAGNNQSPRVRDSASSELEILRAGSPGRFAAFQASNAFNSGGAASQKRKEKLTAA